MALHTHINNLNAGELSPLLHSRTDSAAYKSGCVQLQNMLPLVQGGVRRRPGLESVGIQRNPCKLLGFNFSTTTSFVIEFSDKVSRFWSNGTLIPSLASATPLQVKTPYGTVHLNKLQSCQLNDVIYLADGTHMPQVLERYGDQDWRIRELHEPKNGFADISGTFGKGAAGSAQISLWLTPDKTIGSAVAASSYATANAPQSTVSSSAAPAGTGMAYISSIQRMQAFFVVPSTGNYEFRVTGVDDGARVRFNPSAVANNVDAQEIINGGLPASSTIQSAVFALTSANEHWIEFLLWDWTRPGGGTFQYRVNGGAWTAISAGLLKNAIPPATPTENELIQGWPAMLDTNYDDITITPSDTKGQITLTATADIFQSAHKNSYWQIAHYRDTARITLGTGTSTSSALRVVGAWDVFSYGRWTGTFYLERRALNSTVWEVIRSWQASSNERNVAASGVLNEECELRLRGASLVDNGSSTSNAFWVLEAADTRITGLVKITGYTNARSVSAYVVRSLGANTATKAWAEGAWSDVRGYPNAVSFYEQRLLFGGTTSNPQRIHGSTIGDFENFLRGTYDDSALDFTLAAADGNPIQWMAAQQGLIVGTTGDEWLIDSGSAEKPITPTNVRVKRQSRYGSAPGLPALIVGEVALFVQRGCRKVREFTYAFERDGWVAPDLSLLAEHITRSGIVGLAYQGIPESRLWCILADGSLIGMTYERDQKVIAWHRHLALFPLLVGEQGAIPPVTHPCEFVSVCSIYSPTGATDEMWFCVKDPRDDTYQICRFHPPTVEEDLYNRNYNDFFHSGALTFTDSVGTLVSPADLGNPSEWIVQPTALHMDLQDGPNRGRQQRISRMVIEVINSSGIFIQDSPTDQSVPLDETVMRDEEGDVITALFTGDIDHVLESRHRRRTAFTLRGSTPGGVHISGIIAKWETYGD